MLIVIAPRGGRADAGTTAVVGDRSARPPFLGMRGARVAYWAICEQVGISPTAPFSITAHQQWTQHLLQTVVAACVVAPAVVVPAGRSWSLRMLASRPLAFVGMLSYGIYLWHYAVIEWLVRRLGCDPTAIRPCPPTVHWSFVKLTLAAVPLSIAAGALSWYLVERPTIRIAHRYGSKRTSIGLPNS